VAGACLD